MPIQKIYTWATNLFTYRHLALLVQKTWMCGLMSPFSGFCIIVWLVWRMYCTTDAADYTKLLSSTCICRPKWHSSIITCYLRQASVTVSIAISAVWSIAIPFIDFVQFFILTFHFVCAVLYNSLMWMYLVYFLPIYIRGHEIWSAVKTCTDFECPLIKMGWT